MAIYHGYWILSSHYTTTLPSRAIMASFSSVPLELMGKILGMLDHRNLKTIRLVSKYHSLVVEPYIFSEAVFDLDVGGIDGLVNIAESPKLRQHVHTIRLHRRSGLKDFGAFEDWQGLIVHEYVAPEGSDDDDLDASRSEYGIDKLTERPMSKQEWEALSNIAQRHLFDDYERERVDLQRHIGGLSALVRSHVLSGDFENSSGTTNAKDDDHSVQLSLQSFE
jgi:hypothetical protein